MGSSPARDGPGVRISLSLPTATATAALTAASALALPGVAGAATSAVTAPADGATFVYDNDTHPGVVAAVDGTATGASQVDLRCADRRAGTWSFSGVLAGGGALDASGGGFHATNVTLPPQQQNCLLVALPTGQAVPTTPAGYAGPRLRVLDTLLQGTGLQDANGGVNQGKRYDFFALANGAEGDADWSSAADGGVEDMYLLAPAPEEAGRVFAGADAIPRTDPATGPDPTSTATGIVVDATNAYLGPTWEQAITPSMQFVFNNLTPFPTVTATSSQAPDGALVTDEHDLIVQCTGADPNYFSPAGFTCPPLKDAGVALDLRTSLSPSGHVVTRRWTFSATDHQAHTVSLVLANRASLTSPARTWRFPGEPGYAPHVTGDAVAPPATAPWTTRFHAEGAPDGDTSTGVGAITSSVAPAGIRFILARGYTATYALHVPATGTTELTNVLMAEATQAALEQDIKNAEGGGGTPPTGGGDVPAGGGGDAPAGGGTPPAGGGTPLAIAPKPKAKALPAASAVIGLPSARTCVSRRRITLHLRAPAGTKIARLTVKVAHRKATHPKVRGTAPIVLAGLPKGTYAVAVTVAFADGRDLTLRRVYRTCAPKRRR